MTQGLCHTRLAGARAAHVQAARLWESARSLVYARVGSAAAAAVTAPSNMEMAWPLRLLMVRPADKGLLAGARRQKQAQWPPRPSCGAARARPRSKPSDAGGARQSQAGRGLCLAAIMPATVKTASQWTGKPFAQQPWQVQHGPSRPREPTAAVQLPRTKVTAVMVGMTSWTLPWMRCWMAKKVTGRMIMMMTMPDEGLSADF